MPKQIARHAPYLRRYARALTGSQTQGDALVHVAVEGLLNGTIQLDPDLPLRVSLYRILHQAFDRARLSSTGTGADTRLQRLDREQRAALLLSGMERFTPDEVAQVLQLDPAVFNRDPALAERDLDRQLATRVLIIEDEPIIALDLTRLVRELGHEVVGAAATRDEAVSLAEVMGPGLVLADIRLADGSSGMDAANDIVADMDIPVIFITAFPEHLLTGQRPEPTYLITKPFREEAVKALVAQALFFHAPTNGAARAHVAAL